MHVYLGTFLIAFTSLALEITFTRLLSVVTWYHLAFFAIATAMLGMTSGAITVYIKKEWFTKEKLDKNAAKACLGYSLVIPPVLITLCLIPVRMNPSVMSLFSLIIVTIACSLPFFFSGIAITVALTKYQMPIGKIYAGDLIGAALGCLLVLGGLEILDAPSLILLCASIGILASLSFSWHCHTFKYRKIIISLFFILISLAWLNSLTFYGIRPLLIKGEVMPPSSYLMQKWNSFSRIAVFKPSKKSPQYWSGSKIAPRDKILQYKMNIDGAAGSTLREFSNIKDIEHLYYDVTNVAYYLRQKGSACIIGVGGGRDMQSAILFGHKKVTGIDVNPIFINLLKNEFREFAGLADREEVSFVADEARSYLSRTQDRFSIIQMSLIDTWASTSAGAFTLSENGLYTIEAWKVFYGRLADDGIFTVSRWYHPDNLGETGRITSLAVASLLQSGIRNPSRHIAMITTRYLSTLLLSKQPFSDKELSTLIEVSSRHGYNVTILPGRTPEHKLLNNIIHSRSLEELEVVTDDALFNYKPPTDENPYFFNMLRWKYLYPAFHKGEVWDYGISAGNLRATFTLLSLILSLMLITLITIVLPLILVRTDKTSKKSYEVFWDRAFYFSLIGAGFMFTEIALIQRLSVFLGHPVYALGILLFTIICSTGIGSYFSERLPLMRSPWIFVFPVVTALSIITTRFMLQILVSNMITSPMFDKIITSIIVIFPLGILMGIFFPTGMRLANALSDDNTPWYWALNGITGVLCSALAVFISIYMGISTNFYIAAACYALLIISLYNMHKTYSKHPGTKSVHIA